MKGIAALALVALVAFSPAVHAASPGLLKVGISLGGTQLVGLFLEYRVEQVSLAVSFGSAVPWAFRDVSLAVQLRRYSALSSPTPYVGVGFWSLLVREGDSWGWLTAMDFPVGLEWELDAGRDLELGAIFHYFLSVRWKGNASLNFRTLVLPSLAYKWEW